MMDSRSKPKHTKQLSHKTATYTATAAEVTSI